ncbi:hypothetical protein TanjilG_07605 [Lupinus angustifolius]|uniref:Uncharacterized protein n=1 Tax=Lupinus angustifolius TaxID=3871 RepID=A0A1J7HYI4_LUPAN|nr:hypothetical protein TanjilG_07605 [Lupinus angustifolius]
MGFIMEFAESLVLKMMEDPKERDRRFREHVYKRHNSQLNWDAQISQVLGRRDPYDDVLLDSNYSAPPKSK